MKKFYLLTGSEEDLKFNGIKLAKAKEKSGCKEAIWELYETENHRFVCYRFEINSYDKPKYQICETHEEVKEYFGLCETAKEIYKQANINCALQVDELDLNALKSQSQQNETNNNFEDGIPF